MLGEFEQLVLLAILRGEGEAFGASIQRLIEEQGGRRELGASLATLRRMARGLTPQSYRSACIGCTFDARSAGR